MGYINLTHGRGDQRQMDKFIYNYVQLLQNLQKTNSNQIKIVQNKPTCCPGVGGLPPGVVSVETMLMQPERSKLINVGFGQT